MEHFLILYILQYWVHSNVFPFREALRVSCLGALGSRGHGFDSPGPFGAEMFFQSNFGKTLSAIEKCCGDTEWIIKLAPFGAIFEIKLIVMFTI